MRSNPLVTEVLLGLRRQGRAQLDHLAVLFVQAMVVLLWWPREDVALMLEAQRGPNTLTALVITLGITTAYVAARAGAEELMLNGQHGLRDWALATPLGLKRILGGYLLGQLVHSLHLVAMASPLLLMAFTVSGGEWIALGACLAALLVQALFFRLCGAITHLTVGQHPDASRTAVRTILALVYVPLGLLLPFSSHIVLTSRLLGEGAAPWASLPAASPAAFFLAFYAMLGTLAAAILYRLLARARRGRTGPPDPAGLSEGAAS